MIWQLSLFGFAMGLGTVFLIPTRVEPFCWLVIFGVCAWRIAVGTAARRFQHGLFLGVANSVWITSAHVIFFTQYMANHPEEAAMMKSMPSPEAPRLMMLLTGPLMGVVSGAVIGVFALIAGKLAKPAARAAAA